MTNADAPEFACWSAMRQRCLNPNAGSYPHYGGRGITVDPRWASFVVFLADVGPRPGPEYTLDRIDNDGSYEPGNVRWATATEQANNRRPRSRRERCGADLHDMTDDNRTADNRCKACRAERSRKYRADHPERVAVTAARSYAAHRDERVAAMRARRTA